MASAGPSWRSSFGQAEFGRGGEERGFRMEWLLRSSPRSDSFDTILMIGTQQQDLVASTAQNQVEMIEDVAAEVAYIS